MCIRYPLSASPRPLAFGCSSHTGENPHFAGDFNAFQRTGKWEFVTWDTLSQLSVVIFKASHPHIEIVRCTKKKSRMDAGDTGSHALLCEQPFCYLLAPPVKGEKRMWWCRSHLISMAKQSIVFLVRFLCVNPFFSFHSHDNPTIISVSQSRKQEAQGVCVSKTHSCSVALSVALVPPQSCARHDLCPLGKL